MKTFGEMVREIREKKGWLQQDLAPKVGKEGISIAYLSQIENPNSDTVPSHEVGINIIRTLGIDAETKAKLEKALYKTISERKVERIYPSSNLLERFFNQSHFSVREVAEKLMERSGERRSRQIVQVWKNGLQLPIPEAARDLLQVFEEAGVTSDDLNEYRRAHLYDTVYFSKDIAHLNNDQRAELAEYAVRIVQSSHDIPAAIVQNKAAYATAGKRRYRPELLDSITATTTEDKPVKPKRKFKFTKLTSEDDESK